MQMDKTIDILKMEVKDMEKNFKSLIKDLNIISSFKCENKRDNDQEPPCYVHDGPLCNSCLAKTIADKWLSKLKGEVEDSKGSICKHCGESVRGLRDAPEIPIHEITESRVCSNSRDLAEV